MNSMGVYFLLLYIIVGIFFIKNSSNFVRKLKTYASFAGVICSTAMIFNTSKILESFVFVNFVYVLVTSLLHLSRHAYKDALTKVHNRRYLMNNPIEINSKVIFVDVDKFKSINDTYGHNVGDNVLVDIAALLKSSIRGDDICIRLGGDEFLIVTHGNQNSLMIESRIRDRIIEYNAVSTPKISLSMGVQTYKGGNIEDFIHMADTLMYEQKRQKEESKS